MNINMPQVGSLVVIRGKSNTIIYEVVNSDEKEGELHLRAQVLKITKTGPGPSKAEVQYKAGEIISCVQKCPHCGAEI